VFIEIRQGPVDRVGGTVVAALNCTISLICLALRQFGSDQLMAAVRLLHVEREGVCVCVCVCIDMN
jgi:hypothetical protein